VFQSSGRADANVYIIIEFNVIFQSFFIKKENMIRLLIFAIPIILIFLFVNEYIKQKQLAEENWENQWEEKKKNFQQEQELKDKEREIQKLKQKLENKQQIERLDNDNSSGFSSN